MKLRALAFDLDDTLIDTSQILVPLASRATFEAMKAKGLNLSFEKFDQIRKEKATQMNHKMIFRDIAEKFATPEILEPLTEVGIQTFYNPPLPNVIPLLAGAEENLKRLKDKYPLFLVTSGAVSTQKEKAKRAGLLPYFQSCFFVDGFKKERKREAFLQILKMTSCQSKELLSIGNRLSQEIHDAKEIGAMTCYFEYGEHVGESPRNSFEIPDYTIQTHKELISTCHL